MPVINPTIVEFGITIQNGTTQTCAFDAGFNAQKDDLLYVCVFKPAGTAVVTSLAGVNLSLGAFTQRYNSATREIWWARVTADDITGNSAFDVNIDVVASFQPSWVLVRDAPLYSDPFDPQVDLPKFAAGDTIVFSTENDVDLLLLFGFNTNTGAPDYASGWDNVDRNNWFLTASTTINSKDVTAAQTNLSATQDGIEPAVNIFADAIMGGVDAEIGGAETMDAFGEFGRLIVVDDNAALAAPRDIVLVEVDLWQ